ncbi:ABC transporter substrate-binding protein [Microbacterium abyssi]|uniref:ABC transporter substrate-binding protein n=1 Tax=Microbacterium abyssi TaxID=2782166 RepID=UPI00188796BA|nr:extracellular solute-binding protein [Microbacterium sp. A18JL241]
MQSHARRIRRGATVVAAGTAFAIALSACASSGGSPADSVDVSTEITTDPVTLTLSYTDDPPAQALIDGFTTKYPNVTIEAQQTPFTDYVKAIKLSMSSSTPPDIAQYNPGAMRSLIPGGLVLDLAPWADAYGWDDKFPASSLEVLTSDTDAKSFGEGGLYAAPGALSVLGVYYNQDLLEQAGITEPPATLADFEDQLGQLADAGIQPLSVAGLEVGTIHVWGALLNVIGDPDAYRDWVFGRSGATIETPGALEATNVLVDWIEQGYISESANAVGYADALADFTSGNAAFHISGNWAASAIETEMGEAGGFFLLPGTEADAPAIASGASVAYSISSKSKNANVAAAFLDYLSSPEAAAIQVETGFMPVDVTADVSAEGLKGQISTDFANVLAGQGTLPFPDFATPAMLDTLIAGTQGLISKRMTAEDYLAELQNSWNEYHG